MTAAARYGVLLLVGPALAQAEPPVRQRDVEELLTRLDTACERGDAAGYLGEFHSDHPDLHQLLQRRLEQLFAGGRRWHCSSSLCEAPRALGDHAVALVTSELRPHVGSGAARQSWFLVVQAHDGKTVPTMAVEVCDEGLSHVRDGRFSCPPCNYRIGADGWLCVPLPADRAETLEAVSFYLPGSDLACDVSVHIDCEPVAAARAAADLAEGLRKLVPAARIGGIEPWQPPSLGGKAPPTFTGARVQAELPDGQRCLVHADALGRLRHVLLLRGSAAAMAKHQADIERLLLSYEVVDRDAAAAEAAARSLLAHTGGTLEGNTYRNARHHELSCSGPQGWIAEQQAGGLFRVAWRCPQDSGRMWLSGYGPPPGLKQWNRERAECWLRELCRSSELTIESPATWESPASADGSALCTLKLRSAKTPASVHLVRLALRDDLLVVLDGCLLEGVDAVALLTAFESLKWR